MATVNPVSVQPPLLRARFIDPTTGVLTQTAGQFLQKLFTALDLLTDHIIVGAGAPNGSVVASPGTIYLNTNGGAGQTLWVKESGANTNTGWVGK